MYILKYEIRICILGNINWRKVELYFTGWGNQDKQNAALLNKPYYDTNKAFFSSFTLSMLMHAETHLVKHRNYAWRVYA